MRKPAMRANSFGRLSASGETATHAVVSNADRWTRRRVYLRSTVVLVLVLSLSYTLYWSAQARMRESRQAVMIAALSAEELFGFGSAAKAACTSTQSITWDELSRSVSADDDGTVSADISRGFSAFAEIQTQLGVASACSAAIDAISRRRHAR